VDIFERLEHRLEGLIERITDGVFRTQLQPVELGKKLTREMDAHRTVAPSSTFVPNGYVIEVGPDNFAKFNMLGHSLLGEFETLLSRHAEHEGYTMIGPISVRLREDAGLKAHEAKIVAIDTKPLPKSTVLTAVPPPPPPPPPVHSETVMLSGQTEFIPVAARLAPPPGILEIVDGPEHGTRIAVRDGLRIGRGTKNDMALTDSAVSREHAEIVFTDGAWSIRDLGSANQTVVNGAVVDSAPLADGDELLLGRTKLVFRAG
jgi:hypothetical protein